MTERDQSGELQQLRAQLAELTRRVYHLEGLLGAREQALAPPPAPPPRPTPADSRLAPSMRVPPSPPDQPMPAGPVKPAASLESRIGGQWLNRVGIVAVLVGLSYFLKLAFENNWIGPVTQVLIGIAAGIALLLWSERFRRKGYPAFAYSLKAVSIGALYLSLWASSQYYPLVPPTVAFLGMLMVTITSAALSLRQNAELLAGFALVGGFLTPVLISTGQNHELALFCYVALLDLGCLWITSIRGWRRLLLGAYLGTTLVFAGWASTYYTEAQLTPTLAFATLFFLLFVVSPFLPDKSSAGGLTRNVTTIVSVLNAASYFTASYLMLFRHYRSDLAWLTLALALLFFALSHTLRDPDTVLYSSVHLALAVGFLSIAIPLKLSGHWIALGWLVEAAALFWASHRSRSMLLRGLGLAALAFGILRLVLFDSDARQPLLLNARFGLYLVAIAALLLLAHYLLAEGGEQNRTWAGAAILGLNLLALLALHFEVLDYFRPQMGQLVDPNEYLKLHILRDFTYSAVWMIYASALMLVGFWKRSAFLRWQAIVLFALTAAKVFLYDISTLERGYRIAAFIVLGGVLLAVSFFYQRSRARATE